MDITLIIIGILIFFTALLVLWGFFSTLDAFKKRDTRRRLETASRIVASERISIIRTRALSYVPWLNRLLSSAPKLKNIDDILKKAGVRLPLGFFVLLSLLLGLIGFYGAWLIGKSFVLLVLGAGFLGAIPTFYVFYKKNKRMQFFQRQFPDALDFLARALRAGHSFPSGIQMLSHEFPDPMGTEFKEVSAEIYYGLNIPDALKNLAKRVDCEDIGFFVSAVIIQRETGGNLAEMMNSIAHIIRERFKLLGKVKALAAEGVYSAWILSLLPFVVAGALTMINLKYILVLVHDPWGRKICLAAAIWLCLGIFVMRRMIKIKV